MLGILAMMTNLSSAKSYKFEFKNAYDVQIVQTGRGDVKVIEAMAVAKNADKAIEQCKMNAVAAALFTGIPAAPGAMGVTSLQPIVQSNTYDENKAWFDEFFKKGRFLEFVYDINSTYPTGENNMQVPGGRRVIVLLGVRFQELRKYLVDSGIKADLNSYFN